MSEQPDREREERMIRAAIRLVRPSYVVRPATLAAVRAMVEREEEVTSDVPAS